MLFIKEEKHCLKILLSGMLLLTFFITPALGEEDGAQLPAAVYPDDTLFYMEFHQPLETLNVFRQMAFWPKISGLLSELSQSNMNLPLKLYSRFLIAWDTQPEFQNHMEQALGRYMALGWMKINESNHLAPLFLFQGKSPKHAVNSMDWMIKNLNEDWRLTSDGDQLFILNGEGKPVLSGRRLGGDLVLSSLIGMESFESKKGPITSSLGQNKNFQKAMSRFPESPSMRAYLNTPQLLKQVQFCPALSSLGKRLIQTSLIGVGPIGFARHMSPGRIQSWVTGQLIKEDINGQYPGYFNSLKPLKKTLCTNFPDTALFSYEIGMSPQKIYEVIKKFMESVAPQLSQLIKDQEAAFREMAGLDAREDYFPYLGSSIAVAWLPSQKNQWPLARMVAIIRVSDMEKVNEFITRLLPWKAGFVAPSTYGLISARVVSDLHEGVELKGMEIDSIISFSRFSPTFALKDNLLIFSTDRSALKETISALHGKAPRLSEQTIGIIPPNALELIHLNPQSWGSEWTMNTKSMVRLWSYLFLKRGYVSEMSGQEKYYDHLGQALSQIFGSLDRATGYTLMDRDGWFDFSIDLKTR